MAAKFGHLAQGAPTILCLLIFLVVLSDSHARAGISGGTGTCIIRERDALLSFKAGLLDPAGRLSSWHGEDCCRWAGVRCSSRTGHVIKLDLRNNYTVIAFQGLHTMHYYKYNSLSLSRNEMSSSLAALQQLRYLDMSYNDFNYTSIPAFMGSLQKLRYLNLSSSGFAGRIPSQLGNLSNLQYLDVSGDYYNGLHALDLSWLSHLSLLSYLDLTEVDLRDVRDWVHMVNGLSSLKVLLLVDCGLTSTVSATSKSNLTHLQVLDLSSSCISRERDALLSFKAGLLDPAGRLSSWHGEDCCRWEGVRCSSRTGRVIKLDLRSPQHDYYDNLLVSKDEMSSSLLALQQLRYLDLSSNDFNNTSIPKFLGSLENLRYLNLSMSRFAGKLPSQLGNLSNLKYLDVSGRTSHLHALDLAWLSRLSLLSYVDLSGVDLRAVRDWVHMVNRLSSPKVLRLVDCGLTSTVSATSKSNLTHLQVLDLSSNSFDATLEHNWFFWDLTSLKELHLSHCEWHGPIPEQLANMTSLEVIDFSANDLVGLIPSNLENLCNLKVLNFDDNNINVSIGEFMDRLPWCSWSTLQKLSMRNTTMTGNLPLEVGALGNLTLLSLGNDKLDGVLVKEHFSGLLNLEYLDLSDHP